MGCDQWFGCTNPKATKQNGVDDIMNSDENQNSFTTIQSYNNLINPKKSLKIGECFKFLVTHMTLKCDSTQTGHAWNEEEHYTQHTFIYQWLAKFESD